MGLYGFLGRSAAGAALGAFMGGDQGQSRLGGAIGGAAMGGFGVWAGRKALRRFGGISGISSRGLGHFAGWNDRFLTKSARMGTVGNYMRSAGDRIGGGMSQTALWIGKNSNGINKYGGAALAALGVASAAHIGSSVMGSNNGY